MRLPYLILLCSLLAASLHGETPGREKKPVSEEISGFGYGMGGCGLGSVLLGAKPGFRQVLAATINVGVSGNQTFAITSGTSNCVNEVKPGEEAEKFVTANREVLERDAARASGETIATLAALLGCEDKVMLGRVLQGQHEAIFVLGRNSEQTAEALLAILRNNEQVARLCSPVG